VRERRGTAVLLISHDIGVIREVATRVLVMYSGRIVEELPATHLLTSARHPYTQALIAAVPTLATPRDRRLAGIPGATPSPRNRPSGCRFSPRCPLADRHCEAAAPPTTTLGSAHRVACYRAEDSRPG
jgi:peptide/nickel transport system permease protein